MAEPAIDGSAQVLEFNLGEASYCVDIEHVDEIVDGGTMTAVPNTPAHVAGVMDLRGRTTTIVNPLQLLDTGGPGVHELVADGGVTDSRIVILDADSVETDGAVGWLVSDVNEVSRVDDETVEADTVTDTDAIRGLIKRDDGFTIWIDPHELTV